MGAPSQITPQEEAALWAFIDGGSMLTCDDRQILESRVNAARRVMDRLGYHVLPCDVMPEAERAHHKHAASSFILPGRFNNDERLKFVVEEVGEVARALTAVDDGGGDGGDLREELVQLAHLAAAWVAVLDVAAEIARENVP